MTKPCDHCGYDPFLTEEFEGAQAAQIASLRKRLGESHRDIAQIQGYREHLAENLRSVTKERDEAQRDLEYYKHRVLVLTKERGHSS